MEFKEIFDVLQKIKNSTKSEYVTISVFSHSNNIRITAFKKGVAWNQEYNKQALELMDKNKQAAKLDEDMITRMFIERANFEYRKNDVH